MSWRLHLDITLPLARFELRLQWETTEKELGLFGPSGSGKTTVLESIAGLRRAVRGIIRVGGETWLDTDRGVNLPPERRGVGYVPQDVLLFPHLDVIGNVTVGAGRTRGHAASAFAPEHVLEVLELSGLSRRPVTSLSGGERQRVALARAVCSAPQLLLLDEPLASVDRPLRSRILPYLLRLRDAFNLPTLHISHDTNEVMTLAREVSVLSEGRLVMRGDPRDVLFEKEVLPAAGLEIENVIRGTVVDVGAGVAELNLAHGINVIVSSRELEVGREALFALRAEDLIIAAGRPEGLSAQNDLPAVVVRLREHADDSSGERMLVVTTRLMESALRWTVFVTPRAGARLGLSEGMAVRLVFKAHACRLLAVLGR